MTSPIEAMEHDMLLRIRDALHPFTFCAYPGEVYIRRNLILSQLVRHRGWVSSQDKFEVMALNFQCWSHGSHPPRGAMQPIVPITTQPDVIETVEQDVDPRTTEAMLAIFGELFPRCLSRNATKMMEICAILAGRIQYASGHPPSASHVTVSTET